MKKRCREEMDEYTKNAVVNFSNAWYSESMLDIDTMTSIVKNKIALCDIAFRAKPATLKSRLDSYVAECTYSPYDDDYDTMSDQYFTLRAAGVSFFFPVNGYGFRADADNIVSSIIRSYNDSLCYHDTCIQILNIFRKKNILPTNLSSAEEDVVKCIQSVVVDDTFESFVTKRFECLQYVSRSLRMLDRSMCKHHSTRCNENCFTLLSQPLIMYVFRYLDRDSLFNCMYSCKSFSVAKQHLPHVNVFLNGLAYTSNEKKRKMEREIQVGSHTVSFNVQICEQFESVYVDQVFDGMLCVIIEFLSRNKKTKAYHTMMRREYFVLPHQKGLVDKFFEFKCVFEKTYAFRITASGSIRGNITPFVYMSDDFHATQKK